MKVFIVAIPLFDANMTVISYKLCSYNVERLFNAVDNTLLMNEAFQSPGLNMLQRVGTEAFALDKPVFAELNQFQVLGQLPVGLGLPPEKLVCIIPLSVGEDELMLERCKNLRESGYSIALGDFPMEMDSSPLIPLSSFIMLDFRDVMFLEKFKRSLAYSETHTIVITDIPSQEDYNVLKRTPNSLFTGSFYSNPITANAKPTPPLKANALQLMSTLNNPEAQLSEISGIIERDPNLSISLLKFINSAAVGIRTRIESIPQAVALLGLREVQKWSAAAISINLAQDRPGEVSRLSLIRARFAENLAECYGLSGQSSGLFLMGLFSLLDVMLEKPMEEAVEDISIDERVLSALLKKSGPLYPVLELIFAYEKADWTAAARNIEQYAVDVTKISNAFVDAITWYKQYLDYIH